MQQINYHHSIVGFCKQITLVFCESLLTERPIDIFLGIFYCSNVMSTMVFILVNLLDIKSKLNHSLYCSDVSCTWPLTLKCEPKAFALYKVFSSITAFFESYLKISSTFGSYVVHMFF